MVQKQQRRLSSCIRCVRVCVVSKFLPSSGGLTVSTDCLCFSFLYSELKKTLKLQFWFFKRTTEFISKSPERQSPVKWKPNTTLHRGNVLSRQACWKCFPNLFYWIYIFNPSGKDSMHHNREGQAIIKRDWTFCPRIPIGSPLVRGTVLAVCMSPRSMGDCNESRWMNQVNDTHLFIYSFIDFCQTAIAAVLR